MNDLIKRRMELVEELLHWPTADLPEIAITGMSIWWLRQLGIIRQPQPAKETKA